MSNCIDLELTVRRRDIYTESYTVDLRLTVPGSDVRVQQMQRLSINVIFDFVQLRTLKLDFPAYGQYLWQCLFADATLYTKFAEARAVAQQRGLPLRMRLNLDPQSASLQTIHWEMLREPETGSLLLTHHHTLFSRYLNSSDWRLIKPRMKSELKALVIVANPSDLDRFSFSSINFYSEVEMARHSLGLIPAEIIGGAERATIGKLTECLSRGFDILYLVCHGRQRDEKSYLWLENEEGRSHVVEGIELVSRIKELQQVPTLVVLASCQSSGTGIEEQSNEESGLTALGPQLAQVGVPAVLAMQGNISMATMAEFMPIFFQELQEDGQIDRALAVARGVVRGRHDWWVPVLFLRLESGKLWEEPLFIRQPGSQLDATIFQEAAKLSEWKIVHTEAQGLLFSLRAIESDIRFYKQQPTEWAARKIEETWHEHCEPKSHHIRRAFPYFVLIQDTSIQSLLDFLNGDDYVVRYINRLPVVRETKGIPESGDFLDLEPEQVKSSLLIRILRPRQRRIINEEKMNSSLDQLVTQRDEALFGLELSLFTLTDILRQLLIVADLCIKQIAEAITNNVKQ